ncbi:MAG TPA: biotin/lipoyl-binding protein, partial [Gammaproteobacteria bacterium]|nr:biotin/lipoyl-binding protein [Gammaproteobacteria bacterium]
MRQDVSNRTGTEALFRRQAMQSAGARIFGSVTVIVPPSAMLALTVAALVLLLLGLVTWLVEIPQRARAIGVLMPPDGFQDIVASAPGRIAAIHVIEGQAVAKGDLLLNLSSDAHQLASRQLQILNAEISLLDEAHDRQLAGDRNRLLALDDELASLGRRLELAQQEHALQQEQVRLLERR